MAHSQKVGVRLTVQERTWRCSYFLLASVLPSLPPLLSSFPPAFHLILLLPPPFLPQPPAPFITSNLNLLLPSSLPTSTSCSPHHFLPQPPTPFITSNLNLLLPLHFLHQPPAPSSLPTSTSCSPHHFLPQPPAPLITSYLNLLLPSSLPTSASCSLLNPSQSQTAHSVFGVLIITDVRTFVYFSENWTLARQLYSEQYSCLKKIARVTVEALRFVNT